MSRSGNGIIGIRREDKRWEQRTPLIPVHVKYLIDTYNVRVLVQPSTQRIYKDQAYIDNGAIIQEDLNEAGTILAVKEVPPLLLLPSRTYMFFSHTIKAQPQNMPLLDQLIQQNIRFLDYETITEKGLRGGVRKVAFGYFAGVAGMIDLCRGIGERLLCLGYSTPFLGIASTYQYPDLDHAKNAIRYAGECIQQYGLPTAICPFTIVVTSTGRVSRGAQDILNLLPVKWVHPFELSRIIETVKGKDKTHIIYCAIATAEHMVRDPRLNHRTTTKPSETPATPLRLSTTSLKIEGITGNITPRLSSSSSSFPSSSVTADSPNNVLSSSLIPHDIPVNEQLFDKETYKSHPEYFEPIFHIKIAPFASAIVNCMYWEPRFPRLLTLEQTRLLTVEKRLQRLIGIEDISCDFEGSIEFTREFTTIESPFRIYDPSNDTLSTDMNLPRGILLSAVDHLPSECPKDASDHFSTSLLPLLPIIAMHRETNTGTEEHSSTSVLPPELEGAIVCEKGKLTKPFTYIASLRETTRKAETNRGLRRTRNESFVTVQLEGHLFDQHIANRALDIIENYGASAEFLNFRVGRDHMTPSQIQLQIFTKDHDTSSTLGKLLIDMQDLVTKTGAVMRMDSIESRTNPVPTGGTPTNNMVPGLFLFDGQDSNTIPHSNIFSSNLSLFPALSPRQSVSRRILLLGAGHVSKPVVEYLLRRPNNFITIGSVLLAEAEALANGQARAIPTVIDVSSTSTTATNTLGTLIQQHDIVISLVPPSLHVPIAKLAIAKKRPMVTASYISPEMANLDILAKDAGVLIMNEAGLDPGIDHIATMYMVDKIKLQKGIVTSFVSVCGGLPAPEAANNPLGYKFSWSPKGAIGAIQNSAHYLRDGKEVTVPGSQLLQSVENYTINPAYNLEVLPNRDSLPYADKYGIRSNRLRTMFRGTLRYKGFAAKMNILRTLGFFSSEPRSFPKSSNSSVTALELLYCMLDRSMDEIPSNDNFMETAFFIAKKFNFITVDNRGTEPVTMDTLTVPDQDTVRMIHDFLQWLGFFDKVQPVPVHKVGTDTSSIITDQFIPLDTIVNMLTKHSSMAYASYERDMALMQHIIEAEYYHDDDDNSNDSLSSTVIKRKERYTATLIEYAVPNSSSSTTVGTKSYLSPLSGGSGGGLTTAMARTVGFTTAIVTQLILDGKAIHNNNVPITGVVSPLLPVFYLPILEELHQEGICLHEKIETIV